jgi:hypothetical protein
MTLVIVLALLANILLSLSHFRGPTDGICDPLGVLLIVVALLLLLEGAAVAWPPRIERIAARLAPTMLGVMVVIRLLVLAPYFVIEGLDGGCPTLLAWLFLLAATVALCSYRFGRPWPRARLPVLLAFALMGPFWIVRSQPKPTVDVLVFEEEGCRALLAGRNPYAVSYPNVYPDDSLYGPGMVREGRVRFFPYPPLSLLALLPGHLLGDVRYANLAALAGSCVLLAATGRRLGVPAGGAYELIVVALALQLDNHVIIAFGWTEPWLALGVAACGYALATGRSVLLSLCLAWIVAIKQYGLLWALPLLATGVLRRRGWAIAAAAVLVVNLPFFVWSPRDFWEDLVVAQAVAPFRSDLMSVPALVFSLGGGKMSSAWFIGATLAAAVIVLRRRPASAPRAILGGTAIVLAFVAFSKQGAPNYLWFTSVAPLAAAMLECRGAGPVPDAPGATALAARAVGPDPGPDPGSSVP